MLWEIARCGLTVFRNAENADILRTAIISDSCKESGKNGYCDVGKRRSRDDDQTERRRIPKNLDQIAYAVNLTEKFVVLIKRSNDIDDVQKEAGDGSHQTHIQSGKRIQNHSAAVRGNLVFRTECPELGANQIIVEYKNKGGNDQNDGINGGLVSGRIQNKQR